MKFDMRKQRLFVALGDQALVQLEDVARVAEVSTALAAKEMKRLGYVRCHDGYLSPMAQMLRDRRSRDFRRGAA